MAQWDYSTWTAQGRTITHASLPFRRRGWRSEIGAAAAGNQLALRVEHLRLGGRELAAHAHNLAFDGEIAGQRGSVVVNAQIDGRDATAGLADHRPVRTEVN